MPSTTNNKPEPEGRAEPAADYERAIKNIEAADIHAQHGPVVSASPAQEKWPIKLSESQESLARQWAADDRLWTTQETVEFNLKVFARSILAATQPVAANPKVEEITRQIEAKHFPHVATAQKGEAEIVRMRLRMIVEDVMAILGPFFPQVSQPVIVVKVLACKIAAKLEPVEWHELPELRREHYMRVATIVRDELLAVSANGTEPRTIISRLRYLGGRLRTDLNDAAMLYPKSFHLEAVAQLTAEWDVAVKDAVTFEMAGAASHNGQGWVRVEDRLPKIGVEVMVISDGVRFVAALKKVCGEDRWWSSRPGRYDYRFVTHWQPLPAPPSEADGPLCPVCYVPIGGEGCHHRKKEASDVI